MPRHPSTNIALSPPPNPYDHRVFALFKPSHVQHDHTGPRRCVSSLDCAWVVPPVVRYSAARRLGSGTFVCITYGAGPWERVVPCLCGGHRVTRYSCGTLPTHVLLTGPSRRRPTAPSPPASWPSSTQYSVSSSPFTYRDILRDVQRPGHAPSCGPRPPADDIHSALRSLEAQCARGLRLMALPGVAIEPRGHGCYVASANLPSRGLGSKLHESRSTTVYVQL
ncbi:hypothetical protein C8Q73DRAFT_317529 [Cubamyces lactineus]|nr:hypothetical protein C8Q73DRAFT_317529 [Cubamyces lactineus]